MCWSMYIGKVMYLRPSISPRKHSHLNPRSCRKSKRLSFTARPEVAPIWHIGNWSNWLMRISIRLYSQSGETHIWRSRNNPDARYSRRWLCADLVRLVGRCALRTEQQAAFIVRIFHTSGSTTPYGKDKSITPAYNISFIYFTYCFAL